MMVVKKADQTAVSMAVQTAVYWVELRAAKWAE